MQRLWVKQGYLERQLSDSVATHPLVNIAACTYGRDNRWCLLLGILVLLNSYITFPPNELMNTVVQFMNLSSSNEINMFLQRTLLCIHWWTFVSYWADMTEGAAAVGRERSLLPSSDAWSEKQGVKARTMHQPPFSKERRTYPGGKAWTEGTISLDVIETDASLSPTAPTPAHSILSSWPMQDCLRYNCCEWLTRRHISTHQKANLDSAARKCWLLQVVCNLTQ